MAIDGIGSVGSLNVSSSVKSVRPSESVQVSDVGAVGSQIKVENIAPVTAKNGSDSKNQDAKGQDRAGVQSDKEISTEKIKSAVEDLNKQVKKATMRHTQCSFKYHEDTNRISITVKDSDTDEIIREIPPEKALDMLAKAWELAGLMVDEKR